MAKHVRTRPLRAQGDLFSKEADEQGSISAKRTTAARTARLPSALDAPAQPFLKWAGGKTQLLSQLFR